MKILLTGKDGQVGFALHKKLLSFGEVIATNRHELDLANPDAIKAFIDKIQPDIIINPAAYTHTSVAIGDAIASITVPVIEVHISNVHAREDFRKISHVSAKAVGSIVGLGLKGYQLATEWFVSNAK